ncbi:MAG: tetratricopeptide repeat protein [Deltaproteobacteria bacterium]|nr:MAG: tetratricopeptide repeat protein [Deltaproteobacteria bacterium]
MTQATPASAQHRRHALRITASFHGEQVEEVVVPRGGEALQIGNSALLAVPVPEGLPYIARVNFVTPFKAVITDAEGASATLDPDNEYAYTYGPIALRLQLVPQFAHRRFGAVPVLGSLAWLSVVLMTTIGVMQAQILWEKQCEWFGICAQEQSSGMSAVETAEYLTRLLDNDLAGSDDGAIEKHEPELDTEKVSDIYMPAGDKGPTDELGGAEEVGPEPERNPEVEEAVDPLPEKEAETQADEELAIEDGTPITQPADPEEAVEEGVADADGIEDVLEEPQDPTIEDKEGFGLPDWYDARDAAADNIEIKLMKQISEERLRIDPNDLEALSVLSYYQYLAMEYEAAEETYDKWIALAPESSAGYNNKALIYKRLGDYKREEGLYRVALALRPNDATALNNLAVNLAHQGRYDEALTLMRQLETLQPGDPYADLHRAKIYAEMGEDEMAFEYLRKALEGMKALDTLHHIEFRQDIRVDPSFAKLRKTRRFHEILLEYYGEDTPLPGDFDLEDPDL